MSLKAGVAGVEITPPVGVELCGYGYYLERASTGVLDPLMARALVLEAEGERVAVVACDLLGVSREVARQTRELIEEQARVPAHSVMLACSHTHAGPAATPVRGCGEPDLDYVSDLPRRLAQAVAEAAAALEPAEVGFALGEAPGLGFNRVEGDEGPLDEQLAVMAVRHSSGTPLAVVYHATAHGVTQSGNNTLLSADWPGAASRRIEAAGGGPALYLAGASGDVNPVLAHTGRGEEAGALVAEGVMALLPGVQYRADVTVAGASRDIHLPLDPIPAGTLEAVLAEAQARVALPDTPGNRGTRNAARVEAEWAEGLLRRGRAGCEESALLTEVQALRVGEGLFLAHGSELFCEYGQALKARLAPRPTFVVGYANDFIGYVPDPEDFVRGGYAAATVPRICGHYPFTTDVGSHLVDALVDLAGALDA